MTDTQNKIVTRALAWVDWRIVHGLEIPGVVGRNGWTLQTLEEHVTKGLDDITRYTCEVVDKTAPLLEGSRLMVDKTYMAAA
jgi:hypothetical protein